MPVGLADNVTLDVKHVKDADGKTLALTGFKSAGTIILNIDWQLDTVFVITTLYVPAKNAEVIAVVVEPETPGPGPRIWSSMDWLSLHQLLLLNLYT